MFKESGSGLDDERGESTARLKEAEAGNSGSFQALLMSLLLIVSVIGSGMF